MAAQNHFCLLKSQVKSVEVITAGQHKDFVFSCPLKCCPNAADESSRNYLFCEPQITLFSTFSTVDSFNFVKVASTHKANYAQEVKMQSTWVSLLVSKAS